MNDYEDNPRWRKMGRGCFSVLLIILAALLFSITMCSCKTVEVTKEVPVVTEKVSERNHVDIVRDTLYQRDSVYHYVQGDTVIIERWHRTVNINKTVVGDTIRDTIPKVVPVTVTKYVEKSKPPWYKKVGWVLGAIAAAALIIALRKPLSALIKRT